MLKLKTDGRDALRGVLARVTSVVHLVRPVDTPAPAYVKCAGCRQGGRDDQHVPDPDQFTIKKGVTPDGDVVGDPATVPAKEKDDTAVKLIDAAPVWCAPCRAWYHAVGCYSLHRH